MIKNVQSYNRKSFMEIGEIFFWTATINQWQKLLQPDNYKDIIISSLDYLSNAGKVDVFGFVIMPNHVHFIWRTKEMNGKETAQGSFLKYTAHEFRKMLHHEDSQQLLSYKIKATNKQHEFWQRDPLAILLYSKEVAFQKLDYVHYNPVSDYWQLVNDPCAYKYSSAAYYELNKNIFPFIKDLREEF